MVDLDKYYEILGLRPGATQEEIKQAYRDLAKVWHPDRFPNDPRLQQKAQDKLKEINEAYRYLKGIRDSVKAQPRQPESEPRYSRPKYESTGNRPGQTQASQKSSPKPHKYALFKSATFWILAGICAVILWSIFDKSSGSLRPELRQYEYKQPSSEPQRLQPSKAIKDIIPSTRKSPPQKGKTKSEKIGSSSTLGGQKTPAQKDKIPSQIAGEVAKIPTKIKSQNSENFFSIGSSQEEVLAIQGPPDKILGLAWIYGDSTVTMYNGKVDSFVNKGNLKVKDETIKTLKVAPLSKYSLGYFTLGSTKDEVLAVQGTPTQIGEYRWWYSTSSVDFEKGRVVGWNSSILDPLKVKMIPTSSTVVNRDYFTLGSTKDEVLAVQGTPTQIGEYRWWYGTSSVDFEKGRVVGWNSSILDPLRVRMK
jgi:curved DNA-binding protein CbpA